MCLSTGATPGDAEVRAEVNGGEGPEGVRAPEIRIAFDDTPRAELGGADRARAEEEETLRREAEEAKRTREATTTRGAK